MVITDPSTRSRVSCLYAESEVKASVNTNTMNTRLLNLAAAGRTSRTQGTSGHKRRRTTQTSHHDRAIIEDAFDTVRCRDETLDSRKRLQTIADRESLPNDTWSVGESWLPEDSTEFGLDDESAWFDDDEDGIVHIEIEPPLPTASGKKRSVVSVSLFFHPRYSIPDSPIESTTRSVDAEVPRHIFGRVDSLGWSGGFLL